MRQLALRQSLASYMATSSPHRHSSRVGFRIVVDYDDLRKLASLSARCLLCSWPFSPPSLSSSNPKLPLSSGLARERGEAESGKERHGIGTRGHEPDRGRKDLVKSNCNLQSFLTCCEPGLVGHGGIWNQSLAPLR